MARKAFPLIDLGAKVVPPLDTYLHTKGETTMLKPKLNQLPHIYNIDKLRVYDTCGLAAEINVGGHHLLWYLENDIRARLLLERTIDEMTIVCEGCLGLVVTLEIFLK